MNCPKCDAANADEAKTCGGCGCELPRKDPDSLIGEVVGHFKLVKKIGAGGMGSVYLSEHVAIGTSYVVKVLHPRLVADEAMRERFRREAVTAGRIRHDNVVFIADFGWHEQVGSYIAMEYLEGRSLKEALKAGERYTPMKIWRLFEQLGSALTAAHELSVVHRDLKPDNVYLVPQPKGGDKVKVLDFGIAKLLEDGGTEKLTATGWAMGTPTYMSPEQAAGITTAISAKTDIYSLGVMLFELLAGQPPFVDTVSARLLVKHMEFEPPLLSAFRPELAGGSLENLLSRMLAKDPAERPESVAELLPELEQALLEVEDLAPAEDITSLETSAMESKPSAGSIWADSGTGSTGQPNASTPGPRTSTMSQAVGETGADSGTMVLQPRSRGGMIAAIMAAVVVLGGGAWATWNYGIRGGTSSAGSALSTTKAGDPKTKSPADPPKGGQPSKVAVAPKSADPAPKKKATPKPPSDPKKTAPKPDPDDDGDDDDGADDDPEPTPTRKVRKRRRRVARRTRRRRPTRSRRRPMRTCWLELSTVPRGAKVFINGKRVPGVTPIRTSAKQGSNLKVEIRKAGRRSRSFRWSPCVPRCPLRVKKRLSADIGL